ncbi:MerR family transcriptional regulator [Thermomicrobium sp.]
MSAENADRSLTIRELAARTGIPPRRIRFYVARGLLPPPRGRGPTARYGPEHIRRLEQIRRLREQRFGLEEIREHLAQREVVAPDRRAGDAMHWRVWEIAPGIVLAARLDWPDAKLDQVEGLVEVARLWLKRREVESDDEHA